jgi:hypothetical protein
VFVGRVLRKLFGSKRDEITRDRRKLHNGELHDLCFSPGIIQVIKSRRTRQMVHLACMGEKRHAYCVLVGKPEGNR